MGNKRASAPPPKKEVRVPKQKFAINKPASWKGPLKPGTVVNRGEKVAKAKSWLKNRGKRPT